MSIKVVFLNRKKKKIYLVSNDSWHFFQLIKNITCTRLYIYMYMYVWTCGGRCKFLPFLIYNRQRHIVLSLSPCSQAKSSAHIHTTWIDRWKEDAEEDDEEEEINRPKEKRGRERKIAVCSSSHDIYSSPPAQTVSDDHQHRRRCCTQD
jgi:hypothetical protein